MNGKCVVADYQTMLPVATYDGPGSAIWDMELAEDGARLAIATRKNGWSVVDIGPWLADGKSAAELASQDKAPQP